MRRATVAVALLAFLALAGSASAYTFAEWRYGNVLPLYDGRSLGLGGAGVASADGVRGMSLNPALIGKVEGIDVAVSGLIVGSEESREMPLHDSFDGIIGYNTFALNTAFYDHYAGAVAFRPTTDLEWNPVVAIGYRPRLDMNYTNHVQFRDPDSLAEPTDKILADYFADGDGGVYAFSIAIGEEVVPDVLVGLGVDFLRGDYEFRERMVYPPGSEEVDVEGGAEFDELTGTQFTLGVLVERLHRVDVGLVFRSGFTLDGGYDVREAGRDSVAVGDLKYQYPHSFTLGVEYRPRNEFRTSVSFDIEFAFWSDFDVEYSVPGGEGWARVDDFLDGEADFDDTVIYRVGVEHSFFDESLARFGFLYEPSYIDERTTRAALSAGLGLDVLGVRLDLAGQVGVREYDIDEGRIRETTTLAMVTAVHSF